MNPAAITPESVEKTLEQTAKLRANYAQQIATLAELEHTLVAKVTEPIWFSADGYYSRLTMGDRQKLADAGLRARARLSCARCGRSLGGNGGEYVLGFLGRAWCAGNCQRTP